MTDFFSMLITKIRNFIAHPIESLIRHPEFFPVILCNVYALVYLIKAIIDHGHTHS